MRRGEIGKTRGRKVGEIWKNEGKYRKWWKMRGGGLELVRANVGGEVT